MKRQKVEADDAPNSTTGVKQETRTAFGAPQVKDEVVDFVEEADDDDKLSPVSNQT